MKAFLGGDCIVVGDQSISLVDEDVHLSEMGIRNGGKKGDYLVTEDVSDRLLRLPFHNGLTEDNLAKVVKAVREFGWRIF